MREADRQRLKEEINLLRAMKKAYTRQMRDMSKTKKHRNSTKTGGAPRNPSGFAQKTKISDELCDFLGVEHGTKMARTEVTQHLIKYIGENELRKEGNKRNINPDEVLERLVGGSEDRRHTMEERKKIRPDTEVTDELTYFNLQVHLNKHFISNAEEKRLAADAGTVEVLANASA